MAYGGEGYKSRLQVTRWQGWVAKRAGIRLWPLPRQLHGAEVIFIGCMTRICLAIWAMDHLAGHYQSRFIRRRVEEDLMVFVQCRVKFGRQTETLGSLTCHSYLSVH